MFKMIGRIFLALIILTILGIGGLYYYNQNHTYINKEEERGNTSGNIYNGGLYSEQDGIIYFSNDYDNGSLYSMTSNCTYIQKLSNDKAVYINADENYIYYIRANDTKENNKDGLLVFNNTGVYRINQNGSNLKAITGNPGDYLMLKGNDLYFQRYDVEMGLTLYRYRIDGSENRQLANGVAVPVVVTAKSLIYNTDKKDGSLYSLNLESYTSRPAYDGSYLYPVYMGDYIYYMDQSDHNKIYRMKQDGTEPTKLVNASCSTYNITNSGKYLYYLVETSKKKGIYRLNLETMKRELIKKGNFKQINVTEYYVFFKDYDNTNTYFLISDAEQITVNTFDSLLFTE